MDSTRQTPHPGHSRTGEGPAGSCATAQAAARGPGWHRAARQARLLSWLSLAYMTAEGAVAITAAVIAGSVALLGFGLDSAIEGLASVIIIWRFTGSRTPSQTAEARARNGRRGHLLPARPLHRLRRNHHLGRPPPRRNQLAGHRAVSRLADRDARPGHRQAPPRHPAGLRGHRRRGHPEPAMRLPRRRRARRPRWPTPRRAGGGLDPAVALGIAALAVREGTEAWHGEECAC